MSSFEFDNVKAEKEDAVWRYNMVKKLKLCLRLTGFLLVLFLFSWSWFPTLIPDTVEVAGDFRRRLVSAFNEPLFTFVLVNIIILVVYILSSQKQTQKLQTNSPDIYDEYVSSRRIIPTSTIAASAAVLATEETVVDKQIVLLENAALHSPLKQPQTTADNSDTVRETHISLSPVKQPNPIRTVLTETKTKPADSSTEVLINQKEHLRTRSMDSESPNQSPHREFRRSETAIRTELQAISGIEPPRKSMDEMSSEEFQSIIDSFIAERKKTILQENTAHYTRRKEKCISIMVKN